MEIKLYFRMVQRGWWLIILTAMVGLSVSLGLSYLATPQYEASARFILSPSSSITSKNDVVDSLDTLDRPSIAATYAEIINSNRIFLSACNLIGQDPVEISKSYTIQAVVLPESSVLALSVSGPDPQLATSLANAIGQETISFTRSLNQAYDLNVLDTAAMPEIPFSPQPVRDSIVGFVLGIAAGVILAVLSEQIQVPIEVYRNRLRIDSDTGVFNKKYFLSLLEDVVGLSVNNQLSIGILVLNGLSDYLGTLPAAGFQSLLLNVTEILHRELRGNDTIGRWNEISFSLLLPNTSGPAANRTFNRVYQALAQPIDLPSYGVTVNLDPHIGGAVYSNSITSKELLEKSQNSLEQARRDDANPVYVWGMKTPFWVQGEEEKQISNEN